MCQFEYKMSEVQSLILTFITLQEKNLILCNYNLLIQLITIYI